MWQRTELTLSRVYHNATIAAFTTAQLQIVHTPTSPESNSLLATLPKAVYRRLLPDLEAITLRAGEVLIHPTGRLHFAYFPTDSVVAVSYAVKQGGTMAKAWAVGNEGMVGISLILGSPERDEGADVQIGGTAYRLPAAVLLREFRRAGALQHLLLRYVFAVVTQASQLVVCGHHHPIEQRLCCFLSRVFDPIAGDKVALTQEQIARSLGVRRVSITTEAGRLQAAGVIEYQRGHVRLVSRKKLEERSCVCASIIRNAFEAVSHRTTVSATKEVFKVTPLPISFHPSWVAKLPPLSGHW